MARSPREMRKELQETVTEQVRDLPIHAVRLAMFGVGRALLLTDRVTRDYKDLRESGVGPVLNRLKGDAEHLAGKVVSVVRPNGHEAAAPAQQVQETPAARPPRKVNTSLSADGEITIGKPKPVVTEPIVTEAVPTPEPVLAEPAEPPVPVDAKPLPVPDYDGATLASVRARLRALSAGQVEELLAYEKAHEARADFIRMFDNRLAKLAEHS
jgi:hypothetical protein